MLPPESSILGETLWIAQATFAVLVAWAGWQLVRGKPLVRFDRWDALVWLTIAGHVLSTVLLWTGGADRRAGLNLCWEWVSLGALFVLLRQLIRTGREAESWLRLLVAAGVCLAGLGIWQEYYGHDRLVRDYHELQQRYDHLHQLAASGPLSSRLADELRNIEVEFSQQNIPVERRARMMFQSRLEYGAEPAGRWALANSLGGFLALVLILGSAIAIPREAVWPRRLWVTLPVLGVLAWTLVLTHSRTAWVGGTFALAGTLLDRWRLPLPWRRTILKAVAGLAVLGAVALAGFLASIDVTHLDDNFVLRSLKTRIQYWIGSASLLAERPLFGVGPGNFRQHYLPHKLPESSEEIQDPHNFLIDLWASGGLLALLAWVGILGLVGREWTRSYLAPDRDHPESAPAVPASRASGQSAEVAGPPAGILPSVLCGAILALLGLFGHSVLHDRDIAWELLLFAGAIPALDRLLPPGPLDPRLIRSVSIWGIVAVTVHLLGAGGIEMPGIVMILLLLIALVARIDPRLAGAPVRESTSRRRSRGVGIGYVAVGIVAGWGCFQTATSPVTQRTSLIDEAYFRLSQAGDPSRVRPLIREATARDPWAAEPWRQLAELEFSIWRHDPRESFAFDRALDALRAAEQRDPWSGRDARFRGEMAQARFELSHERKWGEAALEAFEQANERIPYHERILFRIALLAEELDLPEKAREAAKKTIEIDEISRRNGHWEKMLDDPERDRLNRILESG
jgi:tetratricopeptide (TPR) repeat protein